jgi:molybdopterin synthase sulfur carrier subunit
MSIRVQVPAPLRSLTGGAAEVQVEAADVGALVEALEAKHKGMKDRLCDTSGELRAYVRLFVNEEDVRFLDGKKTPLNAGDTVAIVPAIAGGR